MRRIVPVFVVFVLGCYFGKSATVYLLYVVKIQFVIGKCGTGTENIFN